MIEDKMVSVIIPVFNVSDYLEKCVLSVIKQTYKNIEIILVDDGSTDQSGIICDKYREKDNRIKVLHKQNGGLSDARNARIRIAKGEYISFVDSDDVISPIFIEIFLKVALKGECDIVAMSWGTSFWDGDSIPKLTTNIDECEVEYMKSDQALERMLYQQVATGAPFKFYKSSIFDDLTFPVGYLYEDVATTYKAFYYADKTAIITADLYAYRMRKDSIIRQKFSEKKLVAIKIFEQLYNDEELYKKGLHKAAVSRGYAMLFSVYLQIPYNQIALRRNVWSYLKVGQRIVMFDFNKMVRKKNRYAAWISLLGMNIAYKIGRKFGQKGSMN